MEEKEEGIQVDIARYRKHINVKDFATLQLPLCVLGIIPYPLPSFSFSQEICPCSPTGTCTARQTSLAKDFHLLLKACKSLQTTLVRSARNEEMIEVGRELRTMSRGDVVVFLDVETTVPVRAVRRFWMVEFGAMLVCPRKLVEMESYSTLIRPPDLSAVSERSARCNGITRHAVASAPLFKEVADRIFDILNGRVWIGHNIRRFDCARIREAFADIGRPAPEPIGMIDSLSVLTHHFGKRAGNLKMATLATYFGLGQQKHRSLDDVRMNLEVLKHCATVILLESSLPNLMSGDNVENHKMMTRSRANLNTCKEGCNKSPPTSPQDNRVVPCNILDFQGGFQNDRHSSE